MKAISAITIRFVRLLILVLFAQSTFGQTIKVDDYSVLQDRDFDTIRAVTTGVFSGLGGPPEVKFRLGDVYSGPLNNSYDNIRFTIDKEGNYYVFTGGKILKADTSGSITKIAGASGYAFKDGDALTEANLMTYGTNPIAVDNRASKPDIYFFDEDYFEGSQYYGNYIRPQQYYYIRSLRSGRVVTVAGGKAGFKEGVYYSAEFGRVGGIVVDNNGHIYFSDMDNHVIWRMANGLVSVFAGAKASGFVNGIKGAARFKSPTDLAINPVNGRLLVNDFGNGAIREVDLTTQQVTTLTGSGIDTKIGNVGRKDGTLQTAKFTFLYGLTVDKSNFIYTIDNGKIRKIDVAGNQVTTISGQDVGINPTLPGKDDIYGAKMNIDAVASEFLIANGRSIQYDPIRDRMVFSNKVAIAELVGIKFSISPALPYPYTFDFNRSIIYSKSRWFSSSGGPSPKAVASTVIDTNYVITGYADNGPVRDTFRLKVVPLSEAISISIDTVAEVGTRSAKTSVTLGLWDASDEFRDVMLIYTNLRTGERARVSIPATTPGKYEVVLKGLEHNSDYEYWALAKSAYNWNGKTTEKKRFKTANGLPIVLKTAAATDITKNSAVVAVTITDDKKDSIIERGIVYGANKSRLRKYRIVQNYYPSYIDESLDGTKPELAGRLFESYHINSGAGSGPFSEKLTGLLIGKTYFAVSFARSANGLSYGDTISFTTIIPKPVLRSATTTSDLKSNSVVLTNAVLDDKTDSVTERGFVYARNKAFLSYYGTKLLAGSGLGEFQANFKGLIPGTVYYVLAFAKNSTGVSFNTDTLSFTTPFTPAVVTSSPSTEVRAFSAKLGGVVVDDKGDSVISRGIVLDTLFSALSTTPPNYGRIAATNRSFPYSVIMGSGSGSFDSTVLFLSTATKYYYRAFAQNGTGYSYAAIDSFTTIQLPGPAILKNGNIGTPTEHSIHLFGGIQSNGIDTIYEKGFLIDTSSIALHTSSPETSDPLLSIFQIKCGSGDADFDTLFTQLASNTRYFVRSYAINGKGISYGVPYIFTTKSEANGPYLGSRIQIPGRIEAEYFDKGDEGVSFKEVAYTSDKKRIENRGLSSTRRWDIQNLKDVEMFRSTSADIEATTDSVTRPDGKNYQVSFTTPGEWLNYSVNVNASATKDYVFSVRASRGDNPDSLPGKISITVDPGTPNQFVSEVANIYGTKTWGTYANTIIDTISLSPGNHVIRINFIDSGASVSNGGSIANVNYLDVRESTLNRQKFLRLNLNFGLLANIKNKIQTAVVRGRGLKPFSFFRIRMHSTPIVLDSGYCDANGDFSQPISLPRTTTPGKHSIDVATIDEDDTRLSESAYITVAADGTITEIINAGTGNYAPKLELEYASNTDTDTANTFIAKLKVIDYARDIYNIGFITGDGSADNGLFRLSADSLYLIPIADAETRTQYRIRLRVMDNAENQLDTVIVINLVDGNDDPPGIKKPGIGEEIIVQHVENKTEVTTVVAQIPKKPGAVFEYAVIGGADAEKFRFIPGTGKLEFITSPDFELPSDAGANNTYEVLVRAINVDYFADIYAQKIIVQVKDTSELPSVVDPYVNTIKTVSAMAGANAVADSGVVIDERGIIYAQADSLFANPTLETPGIKIINAGSQSGVFSKAINGLTENTNYVLRAYVKSNGTPLYSQVVNFKTAVDSRQPVVSYETPLSLFRSKSYTIEPNVMSGEIPAQELQNVNTIAGTGATGSTDSLALLSTFNTPFGIATNPSGGIIVADANNNRIRMITTSGNVINIAGSIAGVNNEADTSINTAVAKFNQPTGVALDRGYNIYVSDKNNNQIRKITSDGSVFQIAGSRKLSISNAGKADGIGILATFNQPEGLAFDPSNNYLYVADRGNHLIRRIQVDTRDVTTIAGTGVAGATDNTNPLQAQFNEPTGLYLGVDGSLFVTEFKGNRIRKIDLITGKVTTVAGSVSDISGTKDSIGLAARFNGPATITGDGLGNLYVADLNNHKIRKIDNKGVVSTFAGTGSVGAFDNNVSKATFNSPYGVHVDTERGLMYVSHASATSSSGNKIRSIGMSGYMMKDTLPAGLTFDQKTGIISGKATEVKANRNYKVYYQNTFGNDSTTFDLEVKLTLNTSPVVSIRQLGRGVSSFNAEGKVDEDGGVKITERGFVISTKASNSDPKLDGAGVRKINVDDTTVIYKSIIDQLDPSTEYVVRAYAINSFGTGYSDSVIFNTLQENTLYIEYNTPNDFYLNNIIQPLVPRKDGSKLQDQLYRNTITFAGAPGISATNGTTNDVGDKARFNGPRGMAEDRDGNIYVADRDNHSIRKITPNGTVSTFAGTSGTSGSTDGVGAAARFNQPQDLEIDATGKYLFVADRNNHKIRMIEISSATVTTVAGTGTSGYTDNFANATLGAFSSPSGIGLDYSGNMYVADSANHRVRILSPVTNNFNLSDNNSLRFDGSDYTEIGTASDLNFTSALTVEAWIKVDAFDKSWQTIVSKGDNSWRLARNQNASSIEFTVTTSTGSNFTVLSNRTVNDAKWHHLAGVYSGNSIKIYIDGVLDKETTGSASTAAQSTYKVAIGHNTQMTDRKWKGNIDEVRIWGAVRTEEEIRDNMHKQLAGTETGLAAYYQMNQGTAAGTNTGLTTIINNAASGSSLNGTMTGFALTGANSNWVGGFESGAWALSTLAGKGGAAMVEGAALTTAQFNGPQDVVADAQGAVYVADYNNHRIRKIENDLVSTFAGSTSGYADGIGAAAKFNAPTALTIDGAQRIYVAEFNGHRIRRIDSVGNVSTFVGAGTLGARDTLGLNATFSNPAGLLLDSSSSYLYVADYGYDKIRRVNLSGYEISHGLPNGMRFNNTTGVISKTPKVLSFKTHYLNLFNDTALLGAKLSGVAARTGDYLSLTTPDNSKSGGLEIEGSGSNANKYRINFTLISSKITGAADGISYSFADDVDALAATPAAQVGTGTKLSLSFDNAAAVGSERGIRLMYGAKNNTPGIAVGANGILAYSSDTSWIGNRSNVVLYIDTAGKVNVTLNGIEIFTKVALPADFRSTDKSSWKHVFRAQTAASANDVHGIDNLVIEEGEGQSTYAVTAHNYYGSYTTDVKLTVNKRPLPKINYGTSYSFKKGEAIGAIAPRHSGGEVPDDLYGVVSTLAGSTTGYADGPADQAKFSTVLSVATDDLGNVYVSDRALNNIRKISKDRMVSTVAGGNALLDTGWVDGPGTIAKFDYPLAIAYGQDDKVYVVDGRASDYNTSGIEGLRIRAIDSSNVVSTLSGKRTANTTNGLLSTALFSNLSGLTMNGKGDFLALQSGSTSFIRKIANGNVSTLSIPNLNNIKSIVADEESNLYLSDAKNHNVVMVTPDGKVSIVAGSSKRGFKDTTVATAASFFEPAGITRDMEGNLYVTDANWAIRKITPSGKVSTLVRSSANDIDGSFDQAAFGYVSGIAIDKYNNLYLAATQNFKVKKLSQSGYAINPALPEGLVLNPNGTITGTPTKLSPKKTYTIIAANESGLDSTRIEIEVSAIPPKISYEGKTTFVKGKEITPLTPKHTGSTVPNGIFGNVTTIALHGTGSANNNVKLADALFNYPFSLVFDKNRNLYVSERNAIRISKIDTNGMVSIFSGGKNFGYRDGIAAIAAFYEVNGLEIDKDQNIYVADFDYVRKILPNGTVSTYAEFGNSAYRAQRIHLSNNKMFAVGSYASTIWSVSGSGISAFAGAFNTGFVDANGSLARFTSPQGITTGQDGNLYVASFENAIRRITPAADVSTFAGSLLGFKDGIGKDARFYSPMDITTDELGNFYVADQVGKCIRKITPSGVVTLLVGSPFEKGLVDGDIKKARFSWIRSLIWGPDNNLYLTDVPDFNKTIPGQGIRKVSLNGYSITPALPPGLVLNDDGSISGTPTVAISKTTYKISAANTNGSDTFSIDIVINETEQATLPTLNTTAASAISTSGATSGGTVTSDGGAGITARGVVWNTAPNPTIVLSTKTSDGVGATPFVSNITGLNANTKYYVRAYATNSEGTAYGNEIEIATASVPQRNAPQLSITNTNPTKSKEYDGTSSTAVTAGSLSGIDQGDEVIVNATANYESAGVGNGKKIIITYTLSGKDASKYIAPKPDTLTGGVITKKKLTISSPDIIKIKSYDGNKTAQITAGSLSGLVNNDAVTVNASAAFESSAVGTGKKINITYTIDGVAAGNYTAPDIDSIADGEIQKATLSVAVKEDSKFAGESDVAGYRGVTITGFVNGETEAVVNKAGLAISRSNANVNIAGEYTNVLEAAGLTADNYTFSYSKGNYSILPADQLLVRIKDAVAEYGKTPVYSVESAKYLTSSGSTLVDLTSNATVTDNVVTIKDGATTTTFTISFTNQPIYSSSNNLPVGTYTLKYDSLVLGANVTSLKLLGSLQVKAKLISVSASGGAVKQYDGNANMSGVQLTLVGKIEGDLLDVQGDGMFSDNKVGTNKDYTINNLELLGIDAVNYVLTGPNSLSGSNGEIKPKQLEITDPILNTDKLFDGNSNAAVTPGILNGVELGDKITVSATAMYADAAIGVNKTITVTYTIEGDVKNNYIVPAPYVVQTGSIVDPRLNISTPVLTPKVYDGNTDADVQAGTLSGMRKGDNVSVTAKGTYINSAAGENKQVIIVYTLTGEHANLYLAPKNDTLNTGVINARQLEADEPQLSLKKPYDGNTTAAVVAPQLKGVLDGDVVSLNAVASYDDKHSGSDKIITTVYSLDGSSSSNYIAPVNNVVNIGVITPIALTVTVNDDAKFVSENDVTGYAGVSYSGFVGGDTETDINTNTLVISRTNSSTNSAGEYPEVLEASGLSAKNYTFDYVNGNYTIIPADQLLVKLKNTTANYGANASYVVESAQYLKSGASLVDLTSTVSISGDVVTVKDGATSTIFTIDVVSPTFSSSSNLAVGTYLLTEKDVTLSANVSSMKLLGKLDINAKSISAKIDAGLTKTYDGNKSMQGLVLGLNQVINGDIISVDGKGEFSTSKVEKNKHYVVSNLTLSGKDSNNYVLAKDSLTGTTGEVSQKSLSVASLEVTKQKTYDGNKDAAVVTAVLNGHISGDDVGLTTVASYDDAKAGTNKKITVSYSLTGSSKENYTTPVNQEFNDGEIIPKPLTIEEQNLTGVKEYDGNTTAKVVPGKLIGIVGEDSVSVTAVANYEDVIVGRNKKITTAYTLTGDDAANYTKPVDEEANDGVISRKRLTISAASFTKSKLYDGKVTANATAGTLIGLLNNDDVQVSGTAAYEDHLAGSNKKIIMAYTISGYDIGNYIEPLDTIITDGVIRAKQLAITSPTLTKKKNYDGNTIAAVVAGSLADNIDGDELGVAAVANYSDSTVGVNKKIKVVYSLTGKGKDNYIKPVDEEITDGEIAKKSLTVSAPLVTKKKVYDGDRSASVTVGVLDGIVGSEDVTVSGIAEYATKDTGTNKMITVVYALNGNDKGNYTTPINDTVTDGSITQKLLTVDSLAITKSKVYDQSDSASVKAGKLVGVIGSEDVKVSAVATYDTKLAGTGKRITTVYSLTGTDASNYLKPADSVVTDGVIRRKQLTITSPTITLKKTIDGNTTAAVQAGTLVGKISGDNVTVSAAADYATPDLGENKTITVVYTLGGVDKDNYIKPTDSVTTKGIIVDVVPSQLVYTPSSQVSALNKAIVDMMPSSQGGKVIHYAITPALQPGLAFDTATGKISGTRTSLSGSGSGSVEYTITAKNSGGSTTGKVTIIYNVPATNISLSKSNIYEGNVVGEVIGSLRSTDPDAGDTHSYSLVSGAGDIDNRFFSINGDKLLAGRVFDYKQRNSYSIRLRTTDQEGMSYEKSFTITISEKPVVVGQSSDQYYGVTNGTPVISRGSQSQLQIIGNGIASVQWTPATGLSNPNILNPIARPKQTTTYTITITNNAGSVTTLQVTVEVKNDYLVEPQNIVTPNGDGINDFWVIKNLEEYLDNEVTIYNRDGKIVYKSANYNQRWDGTSGGRKLATGTYYYILRFRDNPNALHKGFITLLHE